MILAGTSVLLCERSKLIRMSVELTFLFSPRCVQLVTLNSKVKCDFSELIVIWTAS